ncbi:CocE/NonD family hydrolase [Nocardioides sp.]|uniref:CocE/NonD family hydrolase n=1 Tax=Nocardioides sp. TaxID=35761 RepID=UPI0035164153
MPVRPRSLLLLLALLALAAPLLGVPGPAAGVVRGEPAAVRPAPAPTPDQASDHVRVVRGTHRWRESVRQVPVVVGPGRDLRYTIDTRLYVPDNASARRPQPAILMTHGFGGSKDNAEVLSTAQFFAAHGYVVLTYSSAGFGASGGCIALQSADTDVPAAQQVMDAVLEPRRDVLRDRRGPVVGTIGGSYGGGGQLPLAAADRRIRATIPGRTWNSLAYALDPNNRVVPGDRTGFDHTRTAQGVFKRQWTTLFYALGQTQPVQGNGGCPALKTGSGDPAEVAAALTCPGFRTEVCGVYQRLLLTGDSTAADRRLIADASAATFLRRVDAPTLLVQGQRDTLFNLNEAVATFTALRRRGVPVGMIWNSGGHGGYTSVPGECEAYDGVRRPVRAMDRCYLPLRALGWMDHWLRGRAEGRGPVFAYHRDWVRYDGSGPDDEQYGVSPTFPLPGTTALHLGADGRLTRRAPAATPGRLRLVHPAGGLPAAYSETSSFTGPDSSPSLAAPPTEVPGQFVAFTTAPARRAVDVVGVPRLRVRLQHTRPDDLVLFAKLYDVAPGGRQTLLRRLIAPVRVPDAALDRPVTMNLLGLAHRVRPGHRLRLVLCTTDATSDSGVLPDVVTVVAGPDAVLTLPARWPGDPAGEPGGAR